MPLTQLAPPYPIFTDKNGDPLDAGYLYFGTVNLNPETNPIQVYYDSAFTQPAAQPLRTSNGYVMRNGSPALLFAGSQFSVTVRNKNNELVIYSPVGYGVDPASISGSVIYDDFTGDGVATVFTLTASPSTKNATNVYIDGIYQSKDNYNTVGSTLTFTTAPPLNSAIEVVSQESSIIGGASSQQITYNQGGSGAITRTVQSRLRDFVSVKDFGAVGDGVTDDTAAIQAALSTSARNIVFPAGATYLIDGGLTSSVSDRTISADGATIKLKDNASSLSMLSCSGARTTVVGGYWDGNRANGNSEPVPGVAIFASFAVLFTGDSSTARGLFISGCAGMGVKFANCNDVLIENCTIKDSILYGIYGEAVAANVARPRAVGNTIDTSQGGNYGQGILFTSGGGFTLTEYEVSGNTVVGPQSGSLSDQAINIGVRGSNGIVSNNITKYGAMGFSEGGDNCVVSGNLFTNLQGTVSIGIEPTGSNFTITGNTISGAVSGILASNSVDYDFGCIDGNNITVASGGTGIRLQIASTFTGRNISITSNVINAPSGTYGIQCTRDVQGISISNNIINGPGTGSGRAIYFDTPPTALHASITGNAFSNWQRPYAVYSAGALTVGDIYVSANMASNNVVGEGSVTFEGSATAGSNIRVFSNSNDARIDLLDQAANVFMMYSAAYNNPEGLLTAGVGTIHVSLNSGGGIYRKDTGTGNTGWVAM